MPQNIHSSLILLPIVHPYGNPTTLSRAYCWMLISAQWESQTFGLQTPGWLFQPCEPIVVPCESLAVRGFDMTFFISSIHAFCSCLSWQQSRYSLEETIDKQ